MSNAIMLSIRPKYADMIFNGTKTVELRRIRPKNLEENDVVLVYVSSPISSIIGAFRVDGIIEKPISELWNNVTSTAGITHEEFNRYFEGAEQGIGIVVKNIRRLETPVALEQLRENWIGFRPPQSFYYASNEQINELFPHAIETMW